MSNASNASRAGNPLPIGFPGFWNFPGFHAEMRSKYNPGAFANTSVPQKVIWTGSQVLQVLQVLRRSPKYLWSVKFSHFHAQHWDESLKREVKVHSTVARSDNDTVLTFVFFVLGWWPVVFFGFCGTRVYFVVLWNPARFEFWVSFENGQSGVVRLLKLRFVCRLGFPDRRSVGLPKSCDLDNVEYDRSNIFQQILEWHSNSPMSN